MTIRRKLPPRHGVAWTFPGHEQSTLRDGDRLGSRPEAQRL